jgi:putative ABC transport system ATP-binding protein
MPPTTAQHQPAEGEPLLRVEGVNYHFGSGETRTQVLFDNEMEVMPGELVILTGPSGSGKTTLLTLIGGLRTLQDGQIDLWDGNRGTYRKLFGMNEPGLVEVRKLIGFIFQRHNLFDALTARQNVRLAQQLKELGPGTDDEAITLLTKLGLGERVRYKPQQLSGGQRQRVAVARALINQPQIVLADEPTAALDEKSGDTVLSLLEELARQRHCTSLIVTHDSRILNRADRIVDMQRGRIASNIVVAERLFLYNGLRMCAVFASLFPQDQMRLADKMSVGVHPDKPLQKHHLQRCPSFEVHPPGSVIVRQGEPGDKFYFIRRGKVDVFFDLGRHRRKLTELGPGEFFGDRSLVTDEPRNATVIAVDEVETYTLGRDEFQEARKSCIPFINRILEVYGRSGPLGPATGETPTTSPE